MYTGITQALCPTTRINKSATSLTYWIDLPKTLSEGLTLGASVAVNGVCQTVCEIDGYRVKFIAGLETLKLTTLNELHTNQRVHIERSLRFGDEVGGHQVSGHVDGTCTLVEKKSLKDNLLLTLKCPQDLMCGVLRKGFIALDGCSLTINDVDLGAQLFTVNLYPHTIELTHFKDLEIGSHINIECDRTTMTIVETVRRLQQTSELKV